jgi:hypothetical protein
MQTNDKEPKRGSIHSFFHSSFKKKEVDTPTSIIDESAQIAQLDEKACCSSNKTSKSALCPDSETFLQTKILNPFAV